MKINKKIAISFVTIAGVLTAVVGITLAQFSNDASLTGNTLSTGNADLRIGNPSSTTGICGAVNSESIGGIHTSDLAPGQTSEAHPFCLRNASDSPISLNVAGVVTNVSGTLDQGLVTIAINCGSDTVSGALNSFPGSTIVTIGQGVSQLCSITQTLSGTATGSAANSSITYDVVFTGTEAE